MERLSSQTAYAGQLPFPTLRGDPLAPPAPLPGTVEVYGGMENEWLPLAGLTVGEIRRRIRTRHGLDAEAVAMLHGRRVGDDVVVRQGERVSFLRQSGEKGSSPSGGPS